MVEPTIVKVKPKTLVGMSLNMSLVNNQTFNLWNRFKPISNQIKHRVGEGFYSLQLYPKNYFAPFSPKTEFIKWAAIEVEISEDLPPNMQTLQLEGGSYAQFTYKGTVKDYPQTAQYIFGKWLPESGYQLDDKPHFEILGNKYLGPENPSSEEEIFIPVREVSK